MAQCYIEIIGILPDGTETVLKRTTVNDRLGSMSDDEKSEIIGELLKDFNVKQNRTVWIHDSEGGFIVDLERFAGFKFEVILGMSVEWRKDDV